MAHHLPLHSGYPSLQVRSSDDDASRLQKGCLVDLGPLGEPDRVDESEGVGVEREVVDEEGPCSVASAI